MRRAKWVVAVMTLCVVGDVFATGIMVPKKIGLPPLAIKYQRVEVAIDSLVAQTTVKQAFQNSTSQQLEATYIFPLPPGASITEFAMMINGKKMVGELVEKEKARKIYQDIVRRMRDPGLLEYMGSNLFKARVFPIPPRGVQEVELRYSEVIKKDSGICTYIYPLRTDERASRTLDDFTVAVKLKSKEPIKTIYSPTHTIDVSKKNDHEATAGFEVMSQRLDKDFHLYWTVSEKDFGVNLLTRREKGSDGFFMLMVSPKTEFSEDEIIRKDMVFVIDTSGSMNSNKKIEQAKEALSYCVANLNQGDRFGIVRFSTGVDTFQEKLIDATKDNLSKAQEFIKGLAARGGTNINEALLTALAMKGDSKRPFTIVFLTDGIPTIGTTDAKEIAKNVQGKSEGLVRIFSFGVGYDVNAHLLDQISGETKATSEYVKPEEDIEVKVSLFYNKASEPVLANLSLDLGKIKIHDVYPKKLPDLFKGTQLLIFGRYKNEGDTAIRLKGEINGVQREFVFEDKFPEDSRENEFVERLWATRKVGYLLDEMRLHGENQELKQEVIQLSKEYGIMTPYTSYLVLEDDKAYTSRGITRSEEIRRLKQVIDRAPRSREASAAHQQLEAKYRLQYTGGGVKKADAGPGRGVGGKGSAKTPAPLLLRLPPAAPEAALPMPDAPADAEVEEEAAALPKEEREKAIDYFLARKGEAKEGGAAPGAAKPATPLRRPGESDDFGLVKDQSGRDAVTLSERLRKMKRADADDAGRYEAGRRGGAALKRVGKRSFYRIAGVWVDDQYTKDCAVTKVKYASDAYFKLVEKIPELKKCFVLGERVIVVLESGKAIQVGDEGNEKLTDEEIAELLKK